MKKPDKYRFTLQWKSNTAEKVQAGEVLECLGNRKSEFVLLAISEYLAAHPEAIGAGNQLRIVVKPSYSREQVEAIIRAIIEEKLADMQLKSPENECSNSASEATGLDIDEMLRNLDLFG